MEIVQHRRIQQTNSRYAYLPYLISAVCIAVILITILFAYLSRFSTHLPKFLGISQKCQSMCWQNPFESAFESGLCRGSITTATLLSTRFLSMSFFITVFLLSEVKGWQYFTTWNVLLISFYFMIAFISSCLGMIYGRNDVEWSYRAVWLGKLTHATFEIAGASAFLVTIVDFSLLDPGFNFENASEHFATTISMIVEMSLNSMFVRFDHYPFNIYWSLAYLVFIWPIVVRGEIPVEFLTIICKSTIFGDFA